MLDRDQVEPVRVLYVAGSGRSGSTLLARLLGQVPGVVSVGEVRNLVRYGYLTLPSAVRCGCGKAFSDCAFWTGVRERLAGDAPDVEVERAPRLLEQVERLRYLPAICSPVKTARFAARLRRTERFLLALYRAILAQGNASVVLDESKDLALLFLLSRIPEIELSVLHLVRDSRAVANSWTRRRRRPEFTDETRFMSRASPATTATGWWYRNLGAELVGRFRSYQRLRYEDLVASPRECLSAALEGAGIEPRLGHLEDGRCRILEPDHLAAGNPMRLERGTLEIRPDLRWRTELSAPGRAIVTLITWPLLLRYGYPLGGR